MGNFFLYWDRRFTVGALAICFLLPDGRPVSHDPSIEKLSILRYSGKFRFVGAIESGTKESVLWPVVGEIVERANAAKCAGWNVVAQCNGLKRQPIPCIRLKEEEIGRRWRALFLHCVDGIFIFLMPIAAVLMNRIWTAS